MRSAEKPRTSLTKAGIATLAACAAIGAAALPASAGAANLVVPKPVGTHSVEVHPVQSNPAPAPSAPAPTAPAPQSVGAAPTPSASPPSTPPPSPPPSANAPKAPPEEDQPGYGIDADPGAHVPSYPANLPPQDSAACNQDVSCLQTWHDWYFSRIQTVQDEDPQAADELRELKAEVDDRIRAVGGVPGKGDADPSDGPGDGGHSVGIVDSGQGQSPGSPESGSSPTEVALGAIAGAIAGEESSVEGIDLGTFDLYTPLSNFAGLVGAPVTGIVAVFAPMVGLCPKEDLDGKVPICQK